MLHLMSRAPRVIAMVMVAAVGALALSTAGAAAHPTSEPAYADGSSYTILNPRQIDHPSAGLLARARPMYLVAYPVDSLPLPSGYRPNCNPCRHRGLPEPFVYHDHVLAGAPRSAKQRRPRAAVWRVIILLYDPSVVSDPSFRPLTSAAAIKGGEAAGTFQPVNAGAPNPYEIDTGVVVIAPVVSAHA
jgi:hypothetical protein